LLDEFQPFFDLGEIILARTTGTTACSLDLLVDVGFQEVERLLQSGLYEFPDRWYDVLR
jgi:hypothetical protein